MTRTRVVVYSSLLVVVLACGLLRLPYPFPFPYNNRERVLRTLCVSRLKQISYACHLYAKDNADAFPPDLAALFPDYISDSRLFVCPMLWRDGHVSAPEPDTFVPKAVCYTYVSGLRTTDDVDFIIAFDEEWNHRQTGACVSHVETLRVGWRCDTDALHDELEEQRATLSAEGREMRVIRPSWSRWPNPPAYPVRPWHERPGTVTLVILVTVAAVGGMTALMIRRRRKDRSPRVHL